MTHQNKVLLFCFKIINMKFAFWLDFPPQPTGMPLAPSWSCRPCRALLESLLGSSLLPTFQPSRGSIAPLLLASCSSFRVSGSGGHEWSGSNNRPGYRVKFKKCASPFVLFQSSLCSACNGYLHGGDSELPGQALWRLAFLLVLHTRLGGTADDLLCRFVKKSVLRVTTVLFVLNYNLC